MNTLSVVTRALVTGWSVGSADRSGLVGRCAFYLMVTGVLSGMWRVAVEANGGMVAGYSASAIVWYIAAAEVAVLPVPNGLMERVAGDIADERIITDFARPVPPLPAAVAYELGAAAPMAAAFGVAGFCFAAVVAGPPPSGLAIAATVPALVLAIALAVVAHHVVGALAFWLGDISGVWLVYQKLGFLLGGLIIPLEVLPDWLEPVARSLPFMAMIYAPARLASGHIEPSIYLSQLAWLVAAIGAAIALFARGEERLCQQGA